MTEGEEQCLRVARAIDDLAHAGGNVETVAYELRRLTGPGGLNTIPHRPEVPSENIGEPKMAPCGDAPGDCSAMGTRCEGCGENPACAIEIDPLTGLPLDGPRSRA